MLLDNHFAPDRRVLREIQLLAARDIEVTILAWDRRTAPDRVVPDLPEGIQLRRINVMAPPGGGRRTLLALMRFAWQAWRMSAALLHEVDLLIVHDIYLLPLGVALSRRWDMPFAYDAHEDFVMMESGRLPAWFTKAAAAMESMLARRSALVVVPGQVRRQRWIDAGFPPPVVLANTGVPSSEVDESEANSDVTWDIVYCGLLDASRRPDLLVELARRRPDLRVAVAGAGRAADSVRDAARSLENLSFIGWTDNPRAVLRRSRSVYYGLDPSNSYSDGACPNNLSQAIRAQRPLIFFCGGEAAEMADRFHIGLRVSANVEALAAAVDTVIGNTAEWDFAAAAKAIAAADSGREYLDAICGALDGLSESSSTRIRSPLLTRRIVTERARMEADGR
jgi:hypothetical protein